MTANGEYAIDACGLVKSFGTVRAVNDVSIRVKRGHITGFLGPNGSGKTTTLRMLCGLLTPDAGSGICLGFDIVQEADEIKRRAGYMTQRFGLYEDLSIRENLTFVGRLYGLSGVHQRVAGVIERLGLTTRAHHLAGNLSGGWKQRLALAAAMLHEPALLLLDEPTAGVDPQARRAFWDEIHALAAEGITVLVSTHYMDEAERCHDIAYVAYGKLIARGTAEEIIADTHLITWSATGPGADRLAGQLRDAPGVETAAAFGAVLHVSGTNEAALEAAIAPYRARDGLSWSREAATLEDVFIHLMAQSPEAIL